MPHTTIVVPCYNESKRLPVDRFVEFARQIPDIRFVMVNDGSRDDTLQTLAKLHSILPDRFAVLDLEQNSGKAEAVRRGVLQAIADQPSFVGFWDADLATPLDAIPGFVNVLNSEPEIEVVLGARLPLLGRKINRRRIRQWIGRGFAGVTSILLNQRIYDTQCGAKLFRVNSLTEAAFGEPFRARWIFDVELLARMMAGWRRQKSHLALRVWEMPLDRWDEIPGSKLRSKDFVKAVLELGTIYWHYLRPFASVWPAEQVGVEAESEMASATRSKRAA